MVSDRLAPFGSTVFTEISALAQLHNATDLGQGYPTFEGPAWIKQAAVEALNSKSNQYPPSMGIPELREAVAERWHLDTRSRLAVDKNITITSGATEALAATFLGLFNPGDEVILFEPSYDAYPVGCALAGAIPVYVTMHAPDFAIDLDAVGSSITERTKAILINTPHNPTGRVFTPDELAGIAELALRHDLIVISDEVYERMVFEGEHLRIATLDGMAGRTITISSVGKSFSFTGWKTGWAIAAAQLTSGIRAAHQFLTFTTPNPMQHATAAALCIDDGYYRDLSAMYAGKRDRLLAGLHAIGMKAYTPQGTYFVLADHRRFGFDDDVAFVDHLITEVGVAAIPPSAFYHRSDEGKDLVRFAFCKDDDIIDEAVAKLAAMK